jgi:hypothetical protein
VGRFDHEGPAARGVSNTLVWKSLECTLAPGQQAYFEVVNRPGIGTITLMLVLGVGPLYLTINRMDE